MNARLQQPHSRVGYVGGANVAGILGISPFRTPLDEYLLITGEREEIITTEKAEFFEDRRDLEPWAAKKFVRRSGLAIVRTNERYTDAVLPWARAEIDFEVEDGGNGETKTVHPNAVRDWGDPDAGDEPPMYVTAQAMWGMGVHPATHCYVQALVGFDDYRLYRIERHEPTIHEIRQRVADFWRWHVEMRRAPQPINHADVVALYNRDSGRAVEADQNTRSALENLATVRRRLAWDENQRNLAEFVIKAFMRDATTLLVDGKPALTWKARADGVRVFRIR
ncbi:YqaJ viral recombinase family protein [Rhodanobacter hydrolyticus]|uniref:YqaJ viral recombinase domain-containing protein n=1 Tax=Rhodanobacter hydrolyticus TaxID=2250595 RepID=A0ABW8J414_9GAMM